MRPCTPARRSASGSIGPFMQNSRQRARRKDKTRHSGYPGAVRSHGGDRCNTSPPNCIRSFNEAEPQQCPDGDQAVGRLNFLAFFGRTRVVFDRHFHDA
jgi:hypothetical protein